MSVAVRMAGITKRFGGVTALDHVDLTVERGSIHAVVGENGAGKTTLMRVLYGALIPDEGTVEIDGKAVTFTNSAEAIAAGVGMVSQHYGIIPALDALQNLILGAEGGPILKPREAEARAETLARRMGFEFAWRRDAADLSPAGAQKLEILKLLWREARIMILDEPTAMLSPADGEALFGSLRQLVAEGATVILVTHRLPEVMDHCSRVTVLRGGRLVADMPVSETNSRELAALIVGESAESVTAAEAESRRTVPAGEEVLRTESLTVLDERRHEALRDVSFAVRRGEIVGVAGVDGNGQRELFQAIAGVVRPTRGKIFLEGEEATTTSPAKRLRAGLRIIPEDRHAEAVVEDWSLEENSSLGLQRLAPLARGGKVDPAARHQWAEAVAARFRTKHGGLNLPMASLSGGNQQRFVAARALELSPKLLIAFQPARGLDLKGTADVYAAIRERCDAGMAALVVSFDLDELLAHCDRIVVLNHGLLGVPQAGEAHDRDAIGRLMVGAA